MQAALGVFCCYFLPASRSMFLHTPPSTSKRHCMLCPADVSSQDLSLPKISPFVRPSPSHEHTSNLRFDMLNLDLHYGFCMSPACMIADHASQSLDHYDRRHCSNATSHGCSIMRWRHVWWRKRAHRLLLIFMNCIEQIFENPWR